MIVHCTCSFHSEFEVPRYSRNVKCLMLGLLPAREPQPDDVAVIKKCMHGARKGGRGGRAHVVAMGPPITGIRGAGSSRSPDGASVDQSPSKEAA